MKITHRLSLVAIATVAVGSTAGSTKAAHHCGDMFGKYTTRTSESRLFVDGGTRLRCDLFFSTADGKTSVAEKDSVITQQVPAFVWQFSGLLPVTDYLKTVAIHSFATEQKIDRWQDVQSTFYSGLRAEGANNMDAKIAFAGAYAFAPRWPLVELVEIADDANVADTKLFSVFVTNPAGKGMSVEAYRAMARDIFDNSQNVTLQDIRGIVDAVDAGETEYEESSSLIKSAKEIKNTDTRQSAEFDTPTELLFTIGDEAKTENWIAMPAGSESDKKGRPVKLSKETSSANNTQSVEVGGATESLFTIGDEAKTENWAAMPAGSESDKKGVPIELSTEITSAVTLQSAEDDGATKSLFTIGDDEKTEDWAGLPAGSNGT